MMRTGGAAPDWSAGPSRVLFLRHDRAGDMILSTGVMRAIARSHPTITLDVLASPANAGLLTAADYVHDVIVFDRKRLRHYAATIARLRRAHYDAVLTLFVLDCFPPGDAVAVIRALGSTVTASGLWLFADFSVPERGWRRLHARLQARLLYAFFRWQTGIRASTLPPSETLIEGQGFRPRSVEERRAGSIRSVLFGRSPL